MVVTKDRAGGNKRLNHLGQECLRWVGVESVADRAPRRFHTVAWGGEPCVF